MKRILAPVDFSPSTDWVVREAGRLARPFNAEVILLHIVASADSRLRSQVQGPSELAANDHGVLREKIAQSQRLLQEMGVTCRSIMFAGRAVEDILECAKREGCDLVVVGSHGRSAMYKDLVGSVTESLLRQSPVPLLVIPPLVITPLAESLTQEQAGDARRDVDR